MGYGDSIMLSGIAKRLHAMTNQRACPVDAQWRPYWDSVWDGLPYMTKQVTGADDAPLRLAPSVRQYYSGMEGNRIIWRKWDIAPGEIRLTDEEREWAAENSPVTPFVVVETRFKSQGGGGANKDWGADRWKLALPAIRWMLARREISAVLMEDAPTFRHACAILDRSIGYVGHEGGLHHAAAALGKPAVVVFGGYISPEITGYPSHKNLYVGSDAYPLGCGTVAPCDHCRASMGKITVEEVVKAVKEMVS